MRAVVQRISEGSVVANGQPHSSVGPGLLVYLAVSTDDGEDDARYLADKIRHLRIFNDADGNLNRDVIEASGSALVVSAFTVMGDARKGRRPSYAHAAAPDEANRLYEFFCDTLTATGLQVLRGVFRACMQVHAVNDGPVCILLDSRKVF